MFEAYCCEKIFSCPFINSERVVSVFNCDFVHCDYA